MPSITDVQGVFLGTCEDAEAITGCTVLYFDGGATGSVEKRGLATGSRQLDPLFPHHTVDVVHAIVLTGGSSFGLDAATGVCRYLESLGVGIETEGGIVPIVPTGVIYDLNIGDGTKRPDRSFGFKACRSLSKKVEEGNAGVGMGATVGKLYGISRAVKGGVGSYSIKVGDFTVGAYVVVNPIGDVVYRGEIIAGLLSEDKSRFIGTEEEVLRKRAFRSISTSFNTTIGVVATDAKLDKTSLKKMAQMASNGLSRIIRPFSTSLDGDMVFSISTGKVEGSVDVDVLGIAASICLEEAVKRAVFMAESIGGVPSCREIKNIMEV